MTFAEYNERFNKQQQEVTHGTSDRTDEPQYYTLIDSLDFGQLTDAQILELNSFHSTPYYNRENSWYIGNGLIVSKILYMEHIKELEDNLKSLSLTISQMKSKL